MPQTSLSKRFIQLAQLGIRVTFKQELIDDYLLFRIVFDGPLTSHWADYSLELVEAMGDDGLNIILGKMLKTYKESIR
jgi:hypothetical protein